MGFRSREDQRVSRTTKLHESDAVFVYELAIEPRKFRAQLKQYTNSYVQHRVYYWHIFVIMLYRIQADILSKTTPSRYEVYDWIGKGLGCRKSSLD